MTQKPKNKQPTAVASANNRQLGSLYAEIMKNRQRILETFIAETGLKPSEIEIVEINDYDKIRWYVQKREVKP